MLAADRGHRPTPAEQRFGSGTGGAAAASEFDFGNLADKPIYLRIASPGVYLKFAVLPAWC